MTDRTSLSVHVEKYGTLWQRHFYLGTFVYLINYIHFSREALAVHLSFFFLNIQSSISNYITATNCICISKNDCSQKKMHRYLYYNNMYTSKSLYRQAKASLTRVQYRNNLMVINGLERVTWPCFPTPGATSSVMSTNLRLPARQVCYAGKPTCCMYPGIGPCSG